MAANKLMELWDSLWKPRARQERPPARPETRELAAVSVRDRWSSYPSESLTPSRVSTILKGADYGMDMRSQAELFEEMEEKDAHLASILQTRKLAVMGLEWRVQPADDGPEAKKIQEFVEGALQAVPRFNLALFDLLDSVGKGYAAVEILWGVQGGRAMVEGLQWIHPKKVTFLNSLTPRLLTDAEPVSGVEPPPFKLAFHQSKARSGHDTKNGVIRVCVWMYLLKNYALKDWARFNELFGIPLRLGKYDPSATQTDRDNLLAALKSLGSDAAGVIITSTQVEFVEAGQRLSGKTNPFEVMAYFCNREMSKAVLGQTLTTDTAGDTGTYSAAKIHEAVRRDILEADAEALAATIREQLIRPLVGFNFGWDKPLPWFVFNVEEQKDLKALSETYKNLIGAGVPVPVAHIYKQFSIPAPAEGEEVAGEPGGGVSPLGMRRAILPLRAGGLELIPQDAQAVKAHQELENLTQAVLAESGRAVAKMLAPVQAMIGRGESLEALRAGLLAAYPEMDAADLGELLYQAGLLAWMKARAEGA